MIHKEKYMNDIYTGQNTSMCSVKARHGGREKKKPFKKGADLDILLGETQNALTF